MTTFPAAALIVLGVTAAVFGLFVAGNVGIVGLGLLALLGAGLLEALTRRRA